jgi:hypothetical protein
MTPRISSRIVEKGKRPIFPLRPHRLPRDPQCGLATGQANAAPIGPGESRPPQPARLEAAIFVHQSRIRKRMSEGADLLRKGTSQS